MNPEIELLVLAWDNYKKNVMAREDRDVTIKEAKMELAINGLLDQHEKES